MAVVVMGVACSDSDDDDKVSVDKLPSAGKAFIETHFQGVTISWLEENNKADENGTVYEAHLSNGFEVDFTIDGVWTAVDGNKQPVPESILALLPEKMNVYLAENYANVPVVEVDKKLYGYKIELLTGLELMFKADGVFIGLDS